VLFRLRLVALLALALCATRARAQASADLPLDDNGYTYINALQARGILRSLSALERPYKVTDIVAAIRRDSARLTTPVLRSFADRLRVAVRKYDPSREHPAGGSPYLTADDNAYYYIDALLAHGALEPLRSLSRPYRVADVSRILADDSLANGSPEMRADVRGLRRSLRSHGGDSGDDALFRYRIGLDASLTGQTSGIRELELGDGKRSLDPAIDVRGIGEGGPLTIVFRGGVDRGLMDDPEYWHGNLGRAGTPNDDARVSDGYVDLRFRFGEFFIGREQRNWGPTPLDGLLLGHYAYSYDHVYVLLGVRSLHYQMITTRLNDENIGGDTVAQRYFTIHRLAARLGPAELALQEAVVYGGVGRGFELPYMNPINLFTFSQLNEGQDATKKYSFQGALQTRSVGTYSTEIYLNDVQTGGCNPEVLCKKPISGGLTFTAEGIPFIGDQRLFASYTLVSFLDYRTDTPWEQYDYQYIGLGRGYSDYDEARVGVDVAAIPGVPLRVYGAYRRQGQGDYRIPVPPSDSFPLLPVIFFGTVEKVARFGVSGAATFPWVEVSGDIGVNHVLNYNHVSGVTHNDFASRVKVSLVWARLFGGGVSARRDDEP
jgi:hypothetical protein